MFNFKKYNISLPSEYYKAVKIGAPIFPILFEFENGLRLAINNFLSSIYGNDWWEIKLKSRYFDAYKYVADQKAKRDKMPWIGDSSRTTLIPLHSVTIGHLEQIVIKFQSECIPQLFPTIQFFTGHMEIVKRVRNMYSHMYPCIDKEDIEDAISEIKIISKHIKNKI
ncbi:MAG: hypothetical protein ABI543_10865 [Ignavibacteria bacterium]